jgi:DUF2075 family protein
MTDFEIERFNFAPDSVNAWAPLDHKYNNWPVVYILDGPTLDAARRKAGDPNSDVYVGETLSAATRMRQHFASSEKRHLRTARVIIDETFNKSVCLDLESYLIRLLAGDGAYAVLNRNDGITEADYFDRPKYREHFSEVFEQLKRDGVFTRTIPEIENSDLFKLSPYKALTTDQAVAVEDILEGLFADLEAGANSTTVVEGAPGTGKTVVAIYMIKLLTDIANSTDSEDFDSDALFSEFFTEGYVNLLTGLRIGLVVPQQSLRASIRKVFRKTPGLHEDMVMTAFDVGASAVLFDLLIVDESHRLNQRANQPSAAQNKKFQEITEKLFGTDDKSKTQLDWIKAQSRHQLFLLDGAQSVRPADLAHESVVALLAKASSDHRYYRLSSQMRVRTGFDYVGFVRSMLSVNSDRSELGPPSAIDLEAYEFKLFDSVANMHAAIQRKDAEFGLSRMVAGFAWPWVSKKDKLAYDIEVDGEQFRWNSTQTDWVASPKSVDEVGSIHTVQGYDLNYAGVIIGPDLGYDAASGKLVFNRSSYFDSKGKENNPLIGRPYSDDDLLRFVVNIYSVLLTRGIRGTFIYVSDPSLRERLKRFIPISSTRDGT